MEDIDDFIDEWHEGASNLPLHTFLGMRKSEYGLWVSMPEVLPFIIRAHKESTSVEDELDRVDDVAAIARSDGLAKSKQVVAWLKKQGLWE
ncbi:hypothetical protein [Ramlibacter alkalitolerans]|uniref:Uncharacterized protein n=1 Tax=Ramlibacter alkalitolerans TaxID=2039631 RepID=A0ABS1JST7_9BURK|nr:hypothetical protein [Ramlibacter alkalitolerans]MBL0427236.1 hypothetical protein [Ramlibacter alkalitolerans]